MLTDVTIEGLRGVGRVELRFVPDRRVYTLFGANGVGKTKCLEAIYQFLLASNKDFAQDFAGPSSLYALHNGWPVMARMSTKPNDVSFEVVKVGRASHVSDVWKPSSKGPLHELPVVFLGAGNRSRLGVQTASSLTPLGTPADRRKAYFDAVFKAFRQGNLADLGMMADTRSWFVSRAQSVNPYQKAADNRQVEIDAVLAMLSEVDARVDPRQLQIDGSGRVFLKVEGQPRELGELSSGFISLVKLMQAIVAGYAAFTNEVQLRHVRGIVLIDEIESHLHAAWQANIVPCLKRLLPNTTFFVATHSPLVLAQLQEGEAYLLARDADGVVRSHVIDSPDRRAFADVLESAFGVDLNALKREALERDDQSDAKRALLRLLEQKGTAA